MMRENQSDSEDGWPPPGEYISPWASREADKASPGGGEGGLEPEDGTSDTIAFGGPASEPRGPADQQWYVAPGYGTSGSGASGAGMGSSGPGGHGTPGPAGPGGYGTAGPGGYGTAGPGAGTAGPGGYGTAGPGASGPGPAGTGPRDG